MTALWTKLRRDLWRSRGQVLAVALVTACAVATSAGSTATARALVRSRDLYYARASMPDAFAEATRVPEPVAQRLAALPDVLEVETRAVGDARVAWPGGSARVRVASVSPGGGRLGRLQLRRGSLPEPGEAAISEGFAVAAGLGPGDRLSLTVNGRLQAVTVSGVALSPEFVYAIPPGSLLPDDRAFGLLWMPRREVEAALDLEGAFDQVVFRLAPGARLGDVLVAADAVLRPFGGTGAYGRDRQISNRFLSDEVQQLDNMARILPAIFLGIAAFLVSMTLSRLVAAQRMQIGTLRALGHGRGAIGLHYAAYAGAMALAGSAAGSALGHVMGMAMSRMYADFYRFPVLDYRSDPGAMAFASVLALAASLAGATGAVRRAVGLTPAEAMRPPAPGHFRPAPVEQLGVAAWLLSYPARMSLRGLARRPWRAVLGTLGMASAVAVLVAGAFFGDAMDYTVRLAFERSLSADATVAFTRPVARAAVHELERLPGVRTAEPRRQEPTVLRHGPRSWHGAISGVEPAATLSSLVGMDQRPVAVPRSGLVVSARLAGLLDAQVGDRIQVELLGGHRASGELLIAATVDDELGLSATTSLETLRHLARDGGFVTEAVLAVDPQARVAVARALDARPAVAGVAWRADAVASFRRTVARSLLAFAAVLVGFAVVISGGVVYSAVRASYSERARELATLRIIGFTRLETWRVLVGEVVLQLLGALPAGALLGLGLSVLSAHALESDLFRIPVVISRSTWLLAIGVTAGAALATTLVALHWIRRLDLAEALREGGDR